MLRLLTIERGEDVSYIRETYIAGKTIIIREKKKKEVIKGQKRAPRTNMTTEKVWNNNLKQAIFRLTLILNNNFKPGDHHLQLTYKIEPKTREEARKDRKKFFRKLTDECRKENIEFKWVAVTERTGGRFHHHAVCSNVPISIIKKCWQGEDKGIVFHNPLWDNPNYEKLANYLLKEAASLHMEEGIISKKRYTTSRNIVIPEGKEETITRKNIEDEPKTLKGYQIDEDSIQTYENEITDTICREYIMVSLNDEPRLKRWRTGKTITGEYINYTRALREAYKEHQEFFEIV